MRPELQPRPSALRCAVCHDAISGDASCPGCGTLFHPRCRELSRGCPTIGCGFVRRRLRIHVQDKRRPRWWQRALMGSWRVVRGASGWLVLFGLSLGWALYASHEVQLEMEKTYADAASEAEAIAEEIAAKMKDVPASAEVEPGVEEAPFTVYPSPELDEPRGPQPRPLAPAGVEVGFACDGQRVYQVQGVNRRGTFTVYRLGSSQGPFYDGVIHLSRPRGHLDPETGIQTEITRPMD